MPAEIECSITQDVIVDPVFAADGHTYERRAIEAWLAKDDASPLTGEVLQHKMLTPSRIARSFVERYLDECRRSL